MKFFYLLFTIAVLALFSTYPNSLHAETIIISGTVTKAPWHDRYYRMEIDEIPFTFMPTVQIDASFTTYTPQKMTAALARRFKVGDQLRIAKQGFRIYRVKFVKQ